MISFEDFKKLDIRAATVLEAEKAENAEKLLKLKIDIGVSPEGKQVTRQIVTGIAEFYTPEELVGKQIIVIVNLEPKTFRGHESQGMLLAVNDETPVLLMPDKKVKPGSKIT